MPSMDDLIWGSESDKLMSYVGFVRLMQDPYHVMRTITKARRELFDKKNRNEDEDESSEEEEDIDSDESGDDVGDGGSEIGDLTSSMDGGGSALDPGVSTMSSKSKRVEVLAPVRARYQLSAIRQAVRQSRMWKEMVKMRRRRSRIGSCSCLLTNMAGWRFCCWRNVATTF